MSFLSKAAAFLKRAWRPILILAGILVAIFFGRRLFGKIVDAVLGKVGAGMPFTPIANDPAHVVVHTPSGDQTVRLPAPGGKQVTSDQVTSIAYEPGYFARVEIKTDAPDRKG